MKAPVENNTVFFDLGNVLVFFSHEKMLNQLVDCTKIPRETLRQHLWKENLLEEYETGRMTSEQFYRRLQSLSSASFSFLEVMAAASHIFIPNLALWEVVKELKAERNQLVLISNTNECHFNYIYSHYPILQLFDRMILSYEVGVCKPNPLIFHHAMKESQGKTFYTDDIPSFVEAGRAAGLDAEVFIDAASCRHHLKERSLLFS